MIKEQEYTICKFENKGGWHYVNLEYVENNQRVSSGWNTVSGTVDAVEFSKVKIWAGAKGDLFFPLNKEIRAKLGKELGDKVLIKMDFDQSPQKSRNQFWECLEFEPVAHQKFLKKSKFDQKLIIEQLDKIQNEEAWAIAMAKVIDELL